VADDGFGIQEGQRLGAAVGKMEKSAVWLFFNPPRACLHGILLSRKGERVCNEELYGATLALHMVAEHDARAILLIDRHIWKQIKHELKTTKSAHFQVLTGYVNLYLNRKKAKSLAELERKCKMLEGSLTAALARYHEGVEAQQDEKGKSAELLQRLDTPPYYAINIDIAGSLMLTPSMSLGGLQVDGLTAQVMREDGSPIDGLYSAGRTAVGVCSHSYLTGLAIADCIFSGRNAGRSAATAVEHG
jgi:3-oxo-5alpha-steroid 4-dehydrogenase